MYHDLPLTAQTAYAQLLEASQTGDFLRSVADLPGSFTSKVIKGHPYWYYQFRDLQGKVRQVYLGPDSEPLARLVSGKTLRPPQKEAQGRLARSADALGCQAVSFRQFRVIERLADHGLFRSGAILVGTHAFLAYGNLLGVRWSSGDQTQDVDFAHAGKHLSLALNSQLSIDVGSAIESLQAGFLPVTSFSGRPGASFLNPREPEFRLDFLTPLHRGGETPYRHEPLGIMLQPLKFMEFSLVDIQQATIFSGEHAVLVNVPHPARYAIHKLIVSSLRGGGFATKATKDVHQAASLIHLLSERQPLALREAYEDACSRGRSWQKHLAAGLSVMTTRHPETAALLPP